VWSSPSAALAQTGHVPIEDLWREVADVLSLAEVDARQFHEDCWASTRLDDRVAVWPDSLRPRYKVASLSNGWSNDRQECEARMGLSRFFDVMVFSGEEGVAKPAPEIYQRTLRRLNVGPEAAVYFDDRTENVAAAEALGMVTALVTTPEQLLREGRALLAQTQLTRALWDSLDS
jgi:epoxide hydrolase-like predicted phosphatase